MTRLARAFAGIDAANEADPTRDGGEPAALLYGRRMSAELDRLYPDAAETLRIAARGQHVERWILSRGAYPEGRTGYLTWRRDLARHHAARVGAIMAEAGYAPEEVEAAGRMLRKEGLKRDAEVQALEDVACFVFLRWYFAPFAAKHSGEKLRAIVEKTARKMSPAARHRVLDEFDLPAGLRPSFAG